MPNSDTNRECGFKLPCLNRGGIFIIFLLCFHALPIWAQQLITLQEAISLGKAKSLNTSLLEAEAKRYDLKVLLIEAQRREQNVSSSFGSSRNEVGDSSDLEATATDRQLLKVAYQQSFEGGFNWKFSYQQRQDTALTSNSSNEELTKFVLTAALPVYGKSQETKKLKTRKSLLQLEQERNIWSHNRCWCCYC